jgi:hypothetical protein
VANPRKADAATVSARVEELLGVVIDGAQFHDIREYVNAPERAWGLSDSQIRRYLARVNRLLVERNERKRSVLMAQHLAKRKALYARCVNAADYGTARSVLADEAKLLGLYPDAKEIRELLKLTVEQDARIRELESRLAGPRVDPPPTQEPGGAAGPPDGLPPGRAAGTDPEPVGGVQGPPDGVRGGGAEGGADAGPGGGAGGAGGGAAGEGAGGA